MPTGYTLEEYNGVATDEPQLEVYLYPDTSTEIDYCKDSGLVGDAIINAAEQYYDGNNGNIIDSYRIHRFRADSYSYPSLNWWNIDSVGEAKSEIRDFLEDGSQNGTGNDLSSYRGVHHLIHTNSSDQNPSYNNGCYGYSPGQSSLDWEIGAEASPGNAFDEDVVCWSPVCNNNDITRNAAIHEMSHCLMEMPDGYPTPGAYDEHEYGTIYQCAPGMTCGAVSPMATYHWDEPGITGPPCEGWVDLAHEHSQSLSSCTMNQVEDNS